MEDEIDLGKYFKVLIRHWKLIIGLAISASVAAFVVSSSLPPAYEATALIVVTRLRNQYEFDPRIQTQFEQQPYKAYPALALTDNLLTRVIAALGDQLKIEERDPAALRERLSAGAGQIPAWCGYPSPPANRSRRRPSPTSGRVCTSRIRTSHIRQR